MSMPLIERIELLQNKPLVWCLRTSKGKIIYVRYDRGTLTCRYDNQFNGQQFFMKTWGRMQQPPTTLSLDEMLKATKFKINHDSYIPTKGVPKNDEPRAEDQVG